MPEAVGEQLAQLVADPSSAKLLEIENSQQINCLLEKYEEHTAKIRNGHNGATAAYWLGYVDLVDGYLLLSRACRTNDLDLFIYALDLITPVLFVTNKQNYARWMVHVRYLQNLLNIDNSHPGLGQILSKGALSVRRTKNSFARNPVNMTLEQTINADAASQLTGITAFHQNVAAKNRWRV